FRPRLVGDPMHSLPDATSSRDNSHRASVQEAWRCLLVRPPWLLHEPTDAYLLLIAETRPTPRTRTSPGCHSKATNAPASNCLRLRCSFLRVCASESSGRTAAIRDCHVRRSLARPS